MVSSGTAVDFRVQYALAIETLVDDFSAQRYAAQVGLVTWPDR
jgi:hypothetical protein